MKKVENHWIRRKANSKIAMIFLADHDKFFLKFHVQLPHHAAGKKVEATKFHGKV